MKPLSSHTSIERNPHQHIANEGARTPQDVLPLRISGGYTTYALGESSGCAESSSY